MMDSIHAGKRVLLHLRIYLLVKNVQIRQNQHAVKTIKNWSEGATMHMEIGWKSLGNQSISTGEITNISNMAHYKTLWKLYGNFWNWKRRMQNSNNEIKVTLESQVDTIVYSLKGFMMKHIRLIMMASSFICIFTQLKDI